MTKYKALRNHLRQSHHLDIITIITTLKVRERINKRTSALKSRRRTIAVAG